MREERLNPETSLVRRLETAAENLTERAADFAKWRNSSIDEMLGGMLQEWSEWTMLPLLRRYCPSYHKVPDYLYRRLGFTPDTVFENRDKLPEAERVAAEEALERALAGVEEGGRLAAAGDGIELAAEELRSAIACLDEVTGRGVGEETLDRIFSRFCIGK